MKSALGTRREKAVAIVGLLAYVATCIYMFPRVVFQSNMIVAYVFVAAVMGTAAFAFCYTSMALWKRLPLVILMSGADAALWAALVMTTTRLAP